MGQGSGVIIDPRGYILTNNHVVAGSQQLQVHLNDGREVTGRLVGADPRFDIALVQVPVTGLRAARLGDSTQIKVGQWAIAIGSPFGLEKTMTVGIISATGRRGLGGALTATSSRRTPPSTPATAAGLCSTSTARWWASTP